MHLTTGHDRLGATPDAHGVNFAVWSGVAEQVRLSLFDDGTEHTFALPGRTGDVFHGHLSGVGPGLRYAFRVEGPWDPAHGDRCNPSKLLADPYARMLEGPSKERHLLRGHA
ncbi:MAG: glycogen debranching enzyme, partial [Acidimicrobiia bacterium]